jgi:hypothetical protein
MKYCVDIFGTHRKYGVDIFEWHRSMMMKMMLQHGVDIFGFTGSMVSIFLECTRP